MADRAVTAEIAKYLVTLPPELQVRVLEFVKSLAEPPVHGEPGEALLRFAGLLDAASAEEMKQAIEDGCERVDTGEW